MIIIIIIIIIIEEERGMITFGCCSHLFNFFIFNFYK
jgi:hypothetical protein